MGVGSSRFYRDWSKRCISPHLLAHKGSIRILCLVLIVIFWSHTKSQNVDCSILNMPQENGSSKAMDVLESLDMDQCFQVAAILSYIKTSPTIAINHSHFQPDQFIDVNREKDFYHLNKQLYSRLILWDVEVSKVDLESKGTSPVDVPAFPLWSSFCNVGISPSLQILTVHNQAIAHIDRLIKNRSPGNYLCQQQEIRI